MPLSPSLSLPPPIKPSPLLEVKHLSLEELALPREHDLCFNCNEKFHRGHCCTSKVFLLIADEDEGFSLDNPDLNLSPDPPDPPTVPSTQISLHIMEGHLALETLRLLGLIAEHQVLILVDGDSTHKFVQEHLVQSLGLPIRVLVGNGHQLHCNLVCEAVLIQVQGVTFTANLHVLSLYGANLVLGVQWLKSLGLVLIDYNALTMKFYHNERLIELKRDTNATLHPLTPPELHRLIRTEGVSAFYHISLISTELPSCPTTIAYLSPYIQTIFSHFDFLVQPPTSLPPSRPTNHHIHLLPNSEPINVRPYRYLHFQKQKIKNQVASMLQKGLILPSTSPFPSLVLLVRKHDGTWRFCVDYRALNAIMIKDRFPIPTIDDLFGELGGVTCFLKLDLLQGYHQILMHEADVYKIAFRTHHMHYEFRVMPFGLCNAPSSFQATMNSVFNPYLCKFIIVFFYDILVYSKTFCDHLNHLTKAFQVLLNGQFFLKLSKCSFA